MLSQIERGFGYLQCDSAARGQPQMTVTFAVAAQRRALVAD